MYVYMYVYVYIYVWEENYFLFLLNIFYILKYKLYIIGIFKFYLGYGDVGLMFVLLFLWKYVY